MTTVLQIEKLCKVYGEKAVLSGLDWRVGAGDVVGLLGRNGAGKTTLLQCALGLLESDAGRVRLLDEDPAELSAQARARIGYVPQQTDLFEWLNARELLDYFRALYPHWNAAKTDALLARWSVPTNLLIGKMSGGEKQRLSVIRALGHEPDVLILDEPVAALDPAGRRDFLRELVELTLERQTTIVFSTHIVADLERIAARVAVMRDGRIVLNEPIDELLERAHRILGASAALRTLHFERELARAEQAEQTSVLALLTDVEVERVCADPRLALNQGGINLEDLFIEVTQ